MYKGAALNSGGASSDSAKEMIVVPKAPMLFFQGILGGCPFGPKHDLIHPGGPASERGNTAIVAQWRFGLAGLLFNCSMRSLSFRTSCSVRSLAGGTTFCCC